MWVLSTPVCLKSLAKRVYFLCFYFFPNVPISPGLSKARGTWDKLRKERDFHRMHHRRVVQEKQRLVTDLKVREGSGVMI